MVGQGCPLDLVHHLGNSTCTLGLAAAVLARGPLTDEQRQALRGIQEVAQRLDRLRDTARAQPCRGGDQCESSQG